MSDSVVIGHFKKWGEAISGFKGTLIVSRLHKPKVYFQDGVVTLSNGQQRDIINNELV